MAQRAVEIIRSLTEDPEIGRVYRGRVRRIVNFGAFVRVRDGLEGLIHISELSHQRVAHPGDVVREGQTIKLKIISLDSERHRLGLSLKQAEEPPARPAPEAPRPRRPREERGYAMSDAVQEPEGGIDNTLAAAFAQVRQQLEQAEQSERRPVEPVAEPVAEPQPIAEPVAAPDPMPANESAVEPEPEPEAVVAPDPEPVAEPAAEPVAELAAESESVADGEAPSEV